jgi:anti-sigma B factor antagonist
MELKLRKISGVYIVDILGELDLYNSCKLKKLFNNMVDRGIYSIIFNLERTEYIDSTGIGAFIYCTDFARKNRIKFCLCNIKGSVSKVISLTKLNDFFNITKDVNEGVKFIGN